MKKQDIHKIAVVIPAHISLTKNFIKGVQQSIKKYNVTVIVVDDSDGQVKYPATWDVYDYKRQKEELGEELYKSFEQFHKSSACRNFGHWIAYKQGFDIIIGLDSDCVVGSDFISTHIETLLSNSYGWENPIRNTNWFPRGFPYFERSRITVLNIGLWENELDVNGIDRVHNGKPPKSPKVKNQNVAQGMIPLCGMNFACWGYAIPGFLFLPNFDDGSENFRRYDDIWGGYIFQKLMQKRKEKIQYGYPVVYHDTIVDAQADATLEEAGIRWEETFYTYIDIMCKDIDNESYPEMFAKFAEKTDMLIDSPFENLISSIKFWAKAFQSHE